ncbi:MAG TPA: DUF3343 domain-containing protein [Bacillota bacterium]|nr:DUF3343 domain-containing protein [Bacillota bacterium]
MKDYIATFHTHADALMAHRNLSGKNIDSRMMPVPRKLSSSCGTCVRYRSEDSCEALLLPTDPEAIYYVNGIHVYTKIFDGE